MQPHIQCKEGDVAENAIIVGDPGRVLRLMELLDDARELAFNREYRTITGKYKDMSVTIASHGIGGPAAAIALEELATIGVKNFIRVGSCGAIQDNIKVGDFVIPDSVVREDDTAAEYVSEKYPAIADPNLFQALKKTASEKNTSWHTGVTVSMDALYSQNMNDRKNYWKRFGVLGQEMEAGTLFTISRLKKLKTAAVLVVVNKANEKDVKEGIEKYAEDVKDNKGKHVDMEKDAALIALEALLNFPKNA